MNIWIFLLLIVWQLIGGFVCLVWGNSVCIRTPFEIFNPVYSYRIHFSVNYFGAIMLSLLATVLCPVFAVCYWFYKLCTFKR